MKVLIDTNILVYAWDSSDRQKQIDAIAILNEYRNNAFLSIQNISEFSSVMLRKGCDTQWLENVVQTYNQLMHVLPIRSQDVQKAIAAVNRYQMSFWDAQIWAVASSNQITVILTEDGQVGQQIEGVEFVNPL